AANFAEHAAGKSLVGQILDPLLGAVGAVNIHTCVAVGDNALRGIVGHESQSVSVKWGICQASLTGQAGIVARSQARAARLPVKTGCAEDTPAAESSEQQARRRRSDIS